MARTRDNGAERGNRCDGPQRSGDAGLGARGRGRKRGAGSEARGGATKTQTARGAERGNRSAPRRAAHRSAPRPRLPQPPAAFRSLSPGSSRPGSARPLTEDRDAPDECPGRPRRRLPSPVVPPPSLSLPVPGCRGDAPLPARTSTRAAPRQRSFPHGRRSGGRGATPSAPTRPSGSDARAAASARPPRRSAFAERRPRPRGRLRAPSPRHAQ